MHEIETKVLDVDPAAVEAKLNELGAALVQDIQLTVDWYWTNGTELGKEPWFLRVRDYGSGKSEITWKGTSEVLGTGRRHPEINLSVSDGAAARRLFEALGMACYAHQEKFRKSWTLGSTRFDLDTYPGMPPYLEIEAESEDAINAAIHQLSLKDHETNSGGERLLVGTKYGLNWFDMRF